MVSDSLYHTSTVWVTHFEILLEGEIFGNLILQLRTDSLADQQRVLHFLDGSHVGMRKGV